MNKPVPWLMGLAETAQTVIQLYNSVFPKLFTLADHKTIKHCKIVWRGKKYYKTNNADHKLEILLDELTFL
jgi:hypothetical protein